MMSAADHHALYEHYVALAGAIRVLAYHTGYVEDLASISLAVLEIANIHLEMSHELARKEREMRTRTKTSRKELLIIVWMVLLTFNVVAITAQDITPTAAPNNEPLPVELTPRDPVLGTPINEATPVPEATAVSTDEPAATDEPGEPAEPATPALPPTTETPEDIIGIVLAALYGGAATIGGSIFVTAVVGVLKLLIPANIASGDTIKNVTSLIVWLLYSLAIKFGFGTQFENVSAILAPILTSALPLIGVLIGSAKLYTAAKAYSVPVWGYQRPPDLKAYKTYEKGQGLVEYALILVLVAVVAIAVLALLGPEIGNVFSTVLRSITSSGG